jgi:hypothetical protein
MQEFEKVTTQLDLLCPKLQVLSPKELGSRKRVSIFFGVDEQSYYCFIIFVSKKSRILKRRL